jgi:hypothetical protein
MYLAPPDRSRVDDLCGYRLHDGALLHSQMRVDLDKVMAAMRRWPFLTAQARGYRHEGDLARRGSI